MAYLWEGWHQLFALPALARYTGRLTMWRWDIPIVDNLRLDLILTGSRRVHERVSEQHN